MKGPQSPKERQLSQALVLACAMWSILRTMRYANSSNVQGKSTVAVQYLIHVSKSKSKVLKLAASLMIGPTGVVEQTWLRAPEPRFEVTLMAAHLKLKKLSQGDRYRFYSAALGLVEAARRQFSAKVVVAEKMSFNETGIMLKIISILLTGDPDGALDDRQYEKFDSAAGAFTAKNGW